MTEILQNKEVQIDKQAMSVYNLLNDPYDRIPWSPWANNTSVYVISDSQLAKYKAQQTQAEILELEKLIDGHKASIESLEKTISVLRKELPEEKRATEPAD